jgi:FixJ family two-component response regulator
LAGRPLRDEDPLIDQAMPGTTVDFKLTKPFGQEDLSQAISTALAK